MKNLDSLRFISLQDFDIMDTSFDEDVSEVPELGCSDESDKISAEVMWGIDLFQVLNLNKPFELTSKLPPITHWSIG